MKPRIGSIAVACLLFAISLIAGPVLAVEASTDKADKLPDNFLGLADERATLSSEVNQLEAATKDFELRATELMILQSSLDGKQKQLAALQAQRPDDAVKLAQLSAQITEVQAEIANADQRIKTLTQKKSLLAAKKERLAEVQGKIQSWLSPEQSFKRWMSITFAILIGIVILGFFVMSWRDERIRQANLSGQAGIQFLTLFCLVIAIILFGITGVLEGKELSALLGGLSGYILGRATGPAKETGPAVEPR